MAQLKRLLRRGGTMMFSNNRRGFQLDEADLAALGLRAQSLTDRTRSPDFARNRQIHLCMTDKPCGQGPLSHVIN